MVFFKQKNKIKDERKFSEKLKRNILSLLIALLLAIIIRSFIVQAFYIPSGSMKPNLLEGDYVFVTKYNYGFSRYSLPFGLPIIPKSSLTFSGPVRGDVVIFKYPQDNATDYVKRLIGLPGETIQVVNSIVYINNVALKREFIKEEIIDGNTFMVYKEYMDNKSYLVWQVKNFSYYPSQFFGPIKLAENEFFMMGDNRDMSRDSRFYDVGKIQRENIIGKGGIIFFSINGQFLEFWKWFTEIRFNRIFNVIN